MSAVVQPLRDLDRALDGARILFRHYLSTRAPVEGWVREFSVDESLVRISKTQRATDAGTWFRVYEQRVMAVLEPARAPALREPKKLKDGPKLKDRSGELPFEGMEEE